MSAGVKNNTEAPCRRERARSPYRAQASWRRQRHSQGTHSRDSTRGAAARESTHGSLGSHCGGHLVQQENLSTSQSIALGYRWRAGCRVPTYPASYCHRQQGRVLHIVSRPHAGSASERRGGLGHHSKRIRRRIFQTRRLIGTFDHQLRTADASARKSVRLAANHLPCLDDGGPQGIIR